MTHLMRRYQFLVHGCLWLISSRMNLLSVHVFGEIHIYRTAPSQDLDLNVDYIILDRVAKWPGSTDDCIIQYERA